MQQSDDDGDDDLYGDLVLAGKDTEIERLNQELFEKDRETSSLKDEIEQLRQQLAIVVEEKLTVETNLMAIYNTAQRELKRKDREIAELRGKSKPPHNTTSSGVSSSSRSSNP